MLHQRQDLRAGFATSAARDAAAARGAAAGRAAPAPRRPRGVPLGRRRPCAALRPPDPGPGDRAHQGQHAAAEGVTRNIRSRRQLWRVLLGLTRGRQEPATGARICLPQSTRLCARRRRTCLRRRQRSSGVARAAMSSSAFAPTPARRTTASTTVTRNRHSQTCAARRAQSALLRAAGGPRGPEACSVNGGRLQRDRQAAGAALRAVAGTPCFTTAGTHA